MEHNKEILDKLDTIINNQKSMDEKYLPIAPYKDLLAIPRFIYEHPKFFFALLLVAGEITADLNKVGAVHFFIKLFS